MGTLDRVVVPVGVPLTALDRVGVIDVVLVADAYRISRAYNKNRISIRCEVILPNVAKSYTEGSP